MRHRGGQGRAHRPHPCGGGRETGVGGATGPVEDRDRVQWHGRGVEGNSLLSDVHGNPTPLPPAMIGPLQLGCRCGGGGCRCRGSRCYDGSSCSSSRTLVGVSRELRRHISLAKVRGVGHHVGVGVALMSHAHKVGATGGNLVGRGLLEDSGPVEHGLGTLREVGSLGNKGGGVHAIVAGEGVRGRR